MLNDNRPMSPHLDIYRWRITMLTSILHRASGVFISFGLAIFAIWLACIASNEGSSYASMGMLGYLFWFVWTIAVYYHLCNGLRHLFFDAGKGFSLPCAAKSGRLVFIVSAVLTMVTWVFVAA